jgi:dolichol-phosphate mannosyltransferase
MSHASHPKLISIAIPVFNEEANVERAYQAVVATMAKVATQYDWEIVFTDNHSSDRTFEILTELAQRDARVRVLRFSRNFGYQRSILTGYLHARGDAVVQLDCDLQDPPELILEFLDKWRQGYEVVYGIRRSRKEGIGITLARKAFYRLIHLVSEHNLPLDAGDFRLVDRRIIEELRKIEDRHLYLRGTIATLGFRQIGIAYDRHSRQQGESKFAWRDLVRLSLDGIVNQSMLPLRLATYTGLVASFVALAVMVSYVVASVMAGKNWPAGFTTLVVLILVSFSANSLFLGIMGEYLGRVYKQQKREPLAIIEYEIDSRPQAAAVVPLVRGEEVAHRGDVPSQAKTA